MIFVRDTLHRRVLFRTLPPPSPYSIKEVTFLGCLVKNKISEKYKRETSKTVSVPKKLVPSLPPTYFRRKTYLNFQSFLFVIFHEAYCYSGGHIQIYVVSKTLPIIHRSNQFFIMGGRQNYGN